MNQQNINILPIEESAEILRVIGHVSRLKIMQVLAGNELPVGEIERRADIPQPALSQQLATLRKTDLVSTRKDGKQVYYEINNERLSAICSTLGWMNIGGETQLSGPARSDKLGSAATFAIMK